MTGTSSVHIISIKTTRRDDRSQHVVTCSCLHLVGGSDSRTAASRIGQEHIETPECPTCHHRNAHEPRTGCTYTPTQEAEFEIVGCFCGRLIMDGADIHIDPVQGHPNENVTFLGIGIPKPVPHVGQGATRPQKGTTNG